MYDRDRDKDKDKMGELEQRLQSLEQEFRGFRLAVNTFLDAKQGETFREEVVRMQAELKAEERRRADKRQYGGGRGNSNNKNKRKGRGEQA